MLRKQRRFDRKNVMARDVPIRINALENMCRYAVSLSFRWPRQCNPVENLADKKVGLNGGQAFSHDLIVEPQAKQASRVAWNFKLNDDPLD